ncbi:CsbD family protein [Methanosarcina sp. Z-7115]|uniref:CsbD family protein n=1 Tax=Methanosarcina baikalica TaxID=3073890 RepID=A0ABU2D333_9EURY|nr:CsbD family protein [Methanosarcina sp. Z-7115]MDR7666393.1 CsbD family protein [Methanosarcina sp. Z-7115]
MKTSTQDQVEGKLHKVKGGIKEIIGELTKDHELEAEGSIEKIEGEAQDKVGQIKKAFGK